MTKKDQTSIYFSGKRLDNGEWIAGNLFGKNVIIPFDQEVKLMGGQIHGNLEAHMVDPETIRPTIHIEGREQKEGAVLRNIKLDLLKRLDVILAGPLREISMEEGTATVTLTLTVSSTRTFPWWTECRWNWMGTVMKEKEKRD